MRNKTDRLRLVEPESTASATVTSSADDSHDIMNQREAAAFLRMSVATLIRHRDEIPCRRVGMVPKYSRRQLLAWIEGARD